MKNKYHRYSKIPESTFRRLVRGFTLNLTATEVAKAINLSKRSVTPIFKKIRLRLLTMCEMPRQLRGEIEVADKTFSPAFSWWQRGPRSDRKTIVLLMVERGTGGQAATLVIPNRRKVTLHPAIVGRAAMDSTIYTNGASGYRGLDAIGFKEHVRVHQADNYLVQDPRRNLHAVHSFYWFLYARLKKYRGVSAKSFPSHIAEGEFRKNYPNLDDFYKFILKMLRDNPL